MARIPGFAVSALAGLAMTFSAGAASAVTIDFGTQAGNFSPYVEDGFSFDQANLTNGQCPSDPSCLLFNQGSAQTVTMTSVSGLPFNLFGFSFHFIGDEQQQRSELTVSDTNTITLTQLVFGNDPFEVDLGNTFLGVDRIIFTYSGPGTGRLDDVIAQVIPLPATLPLFLAALGGLGFFGWRRRVAA